MSKFLDELFIDRIKSGKGVLKEMAPQRVSMEDSYVERFKKDILDNLDKAKLIEWYKGDEVGFYSLRTRIGDYYFLCDENHIYYFVHYVEVDDFENISRVPFRQCLVWRDRKNPIMATVGFAKKVFWDRLFKKYGAVVSDVEQTEHGEGLWDNLTLEAFKKGYTVRVHNTEDGTFKEYSSRDDLAQDKKKIYGYERFYQRYVISIEKK